MIRYTFYFVRECGVETDLLAEQASSLHPSQTRFGVISIVIQGRRAQEAMCGGLREVGSQEKLHVAIGMHSLQWMRKPSTRRPSQSTATDVT
jgi:hypothetical protein